MINLLYHHCTNLENVVYGKIKPNPKYSDKDFLPSYKWLEKEIGFYPLFLSVGNEKEIIRLTGYQNQWRIKTAVEEERADGIYLLRSHRIRGDYPNNVLFSFNNLDGIYTDYTIWEKDVLGDVQYWNISEYIRKRLFKKSWNKTRWIKKAKMKRQYVQLVKPELDLTKADRILTRNRDTKIKLEKMGFSNVKVKRLLLKY